MIKLDNITVVLPNFRLKEIDLHIRENDFFALIGPTGSGKSLLLETIMGFMPVRGGRIFRKGEDITELAVEKRNFSIVYQDFALFPHLDVTRNILYGTRYYRISKKTAAERFDMLVSTLGLGKILNRLPAKLSGGEKQRTALARSLMLNPLALLLDEPLSALDPIFLEETKALLKQIHREFQVTILMVSHSFPDVLDLADRGAIIHNGEIIQVGGIEDIFEKPNSGFTANFVGMKNVFPISRRKDRIFIDSLQITPAEFPLNTPAYAGIRPENIFLINTDTETCENSFSGEVTDISSAGIYCTIRIRSSEVMFTAIWPRNYLRNYRIEIGKKVIFGFHADKVHLF